VLRSYEDMFDPEVGLVWHARGALHTTYGSLLFSLALLERGWDEDVERAAAIIRRTLEDQK
jgi:hypothetical protein